MYFLMKAHTGIYSIIGNLNKSTNIVSLEPYYLNFSMLDNLKLNQLSMKMH